MKTTSGLEREEERKGKAKETKGIIGGDWGWLEEDKETIFCCFFHHCGSRGADEVMERRLRKKRKKNEERRTIEGVFRRIIFGS